MWIRWARRSQGAHFSGLLPPAGPARPRSLGPGGIPGVVVDHHPVAEAQRLAGGHGTGTIPQERGVHRVGPAVAVAVPRPGRWRRTAPGATGWPGGRARTRPRAVRRPCPTGRTTVTAGAPPGRAPSRRRPPGGCRASPPGPGGPAPSRPPRTGERRAVEQGVGGRGQRHVPVDGVGVVTQGHVGEPAPLPHGDGPAVGTDPVQLALDGGARRRGGPSWRWTP